MKQRVSGSPRRGQVLVLMVLAITALLAATALVIDGGNAFAQQRRTQNGIDAAAEAGATQLARKLAGVTIGDADVAAAIDATAVANEITTVDSAEYTNRAGVPLGPVGGETIPGGTQGVKVVGSRDFATYIAGVVGMNSWRSSADATAITGYAEDTGYGGLLPITFPILLTQCEPGGGSSKLYFPDDGASPPGMEWPFGPANRIAIPLCSNGPGNVGWIDWTPTAGGAAEVAASIRGADSPPISTPRWYYITQTGAIASLDDDMDIWEGKDVTFPIFYAQADDPSTGPDESLIGTCDAEPRGAKDDLGDCPAADIGANGPGWYFLVGLGVFHLEHAYIQGNFEAECDDPSLVSTASPTFVTNTENNCLIGYFKDRVVAANVTVGGTTPTTKFSPLAIQLID